MNPLHEAARQTQWLLGEIGRELRIARINAGMRQTDVARPLRTSKSRISRVEHGRVARLSVDAISRHAAAVGLRPYLKLYPAGRRLLDRPQLELLERFHSRLHPSWGWETEVPMPIKGDLRSADARIRIRACSVVVEAITRLADFEAQSRAGNLKKRDLQADRLILVLAATRANRRALGEAAPLIRASYPLSTKTVMRRLSEGRDPGSDAVVLL
jgi:transcriptional regulator with XRE-family HTH domain